MVPFSHGALPQGLATWDAYEGYDPAIEGTLKEKIVEVRQGGGHGDREVGMEKRRWHDARGTHVECTGYRGGCMAYIVWGMW